MAIRGGRTGSGEMVTWSAKTASVADFLKLLLLFTNNSKCRVGFLIHLQTALSRSSITD